MKTKETSVLCSLATILLLQALIKEGWGNHLGLWVLYHKNPLTGVADRSEQSLCSWLNFSCYTIISVYISNALKHPVNVWVHTPHVGTHVCVRKWRLEVNLVMAFLLWNTSTTTIVLIKKKILEILIDLLKTQSPKSGNNKYRCVYTYLIKIQISSFLLVYYYGINQHTPHPQWKIVGVKNCWLSLTIPWLDWNSLDGPFCGCT